MKDLLESITVGLVMAERKAIDTALCEALMTHLGYLPTMREVGLHGRREIMPNKFSMIFWDDQPIFVVTETETSVSPEGIYTVSLKTGTIPPQSKPQPIPAMNPEIQRLTNLLKSFQNKAALSRETMRVEQAKLDLWEDSANQVDKLIAQAEKESATTHVIVSEGTHIRCDKCQRVHPPTRECLCANNPDTDVKLM